MAKDYDILVNFSKALIDNGDGTFTLRTSLGNGIGMFLRLDQTTPESVINGAPHFQGGSTDAIVIKAGKRLVFDGA